MIKIPFITPLAHVFKSLLNPTRVLPDLRVQDISAIPFKELKEQGFAAICFDRDNCITLPEAYQVHGPLQDAWNECVKVFGANRVLVFSNSAGSSDDIGFCKASRLELALGIPVLRHNTKKPYGGSMVLRHFNFNYNEASRVIFVGDRLLTDVAMGNAHGMYTILTKPLVAEPDMGMWLVRKLEQTQLRQLDWLEKQRNWQRKVFRRELTTVAAGLQNYSQRPEATLLLDFQETKLEPVRQSADVPEITREVPNTASDCTGDSGTLLK